MQKIPTVFERDWDGDRSRVLEQVTPEAAWVIAGEGVATRKYDGSSCLLRGGNLFKRHEVKPGRTMPAGFEQVDSREAPDGSGTILTGWVPISAGPEDKWHREALDALMAENYGDGVQELDGTYELLGPKVQRNPEGLESHVLLRHSEATPLLVPRTFEGMRDLLLAFNHPESVLDGKEGLGIEGFVFHHEDGRMAKIKAKDFGIRRPVPVKTPA